MLADDLQSMDARGADALQCERWRGESADVERLHARQAFREIGECAEGLDLERIAGGLETADEFWRSGIADVDDADALIVISDERGVAGERDAFCTAGRVELGSAPHAERVGDVVDFKSAARSRHVSVVAGNAHALTGVRGGSGTDEARILRIGHVHAG